MKKSIRALLAILFIALFGVWLTISFISFGEAETKVIENKPKKQVYEPPFTHEANLSFTRSVDSLITTVKVELAENDQEISYGMMYRKNLDADAGMLFMMPKEEEQSFWMKNTLLPLDMIFINSKNEIVNIKTHTKPQSEKAVLSEYPASKILEVNAGFADRFGLQKGDKAVLKGI